VDSLLAKVDTHRLPNRFEETPVSEIALLKRQLGGLQGEEIALSPLGGETSNPATSTDAKFTDPMFSYIRENRCVLP
jgi:hypothetical protein